MFLNRLILFLLKFLAVILIFISGSVVAQDTLYFENFTGKANKGFRGPNLWDTIGVSTLWTLDVSGCIMNSGDWFYVRNVGFNEVFTGRDTDGPAVWRSKIVDISTYYFANLSVYLPASNNCDAGDYLRIYYKLNGGPETLFTTNGNNNGNISIAKYATANNLTGNNIQIVIRLNNSSDSEDYFFDNILISGYKNILYSISNADWDQPGTWSYRSGGISCGCIPNDSTEVHIESSHTVTFDSDGGAGRLFVEGALNWNTNNATLNIYGDTIYVANGGCINESGFSDAGLVLHRNSDIIVNDVATGIDLDNVTVTGQDIYPLDESFEGSWLPSGWVKYNPDGGTGWTSITVGTSPLPGWWGGTCTATPDGNGGSKMAYATWITGGFSSNNQWLVTKQVTNVTASDSLTFWMNKYSSSYYDRVDLLISTTNNQMSSFTVYLDSIKLLPAQKGWYYYAYSLKNFAGQNIYIAFKEWVNNNWIDGDAIFIDQVKVKRPDTVSVKLSGPGRFVINGNLTLNKRTSVTNNMTDTLVIENEFIFGGDNTAIINNGIIQIYWDIDLGTAGNSYITNNSGGSILVGNDVSGTSFSSFKIYNYGTFSVYNNLSNSQSGSNASSFYNYANASLYLGHEDESDMNWKLYASYAGNTVTYNRGHDNEDQPVFIPEISYFNLTMSESTVKRGMGDLTINGNLLINESAQFDPATSIGLFLGNSNITLHGNWTDISIAPDPFIEGTQIVYFTGSTNQTILCGNGEEFFSLEINKTSGGVYLDSASGTNIAIITGGNLTLTQGIVYTGNTYKIYVQDDAMINGGDINSHIDGPVTKIGDDGFIFPIGDEGFYAPMEISQPLLLTDSLTAQYINEEPPNHTFIGGGIHHVSKVEYWILDIPYVGVNVNVTLFWTNGNNSGVIDVNDLLFVYYHPVILRWELEPSVANGDSLAGDISISGLPFLFGYKQYKMTLASAAGINPLPIELLDFNAYVYGDVVKIDWTTASEFNNDFFTIEKTIDGIDFETVSKVDAAGTSNILLHYSTIDHHPYHGLSYYRLKQTDFDGKFEYSKLVPVVFESCIKLEIISIIQVNMGHLLLNIKSFADNDLLIGLFNLNGQLLKATEQKTLYDGINSFEIAIHDLPAGCYILNMRSARENLSAKVILH